jgi:hypothetical protein
MSGSIIALLCLAALVLYWTHLQAADTAAIVCPHCGDLVVLPRNSFQRCPSCNRLVVG